MTEWVAGTVISNTRWTERLFSLRVRADIAPFQAGQFTKLALDLDGERVQRAYSYVNGSANPELEFYIIQAPQGRLSPALQRLQPGDPLWLTRDANGFFVLDEIPLQINPHFTNALPEGHKGETREQRIRELLVVAPELTVIGLPEGNWIKVSNGKSVLGGPNTTYIFKAGEEAVAVEAGHCF